MTVRFVVARPHELAPYVESMRALEREIAYPIADGADEFRIDHGDAYHPFFSEMGTAYFVLALEGERVVGTVTGIYRDAVIRERTRKALYAADFKVARSHRGGHLARSLLFFAARATFRMPGGLSWRLAYIAAMRGKRGDVTSTVRGIHLGQVASPLARLAVYFAPPEQLASLDTSSPPAPPRPDRGIDLSPADAPHLVSTAGKKDLRLSSTDGAPWPLVHLPHGPATALPTWPAYLRASGQEMIDRGMRGPACFAVDDRLVDHVAWLERRGVKPGAACTVYALSLTRSTWGTSWAHLATSEI